MPFFDANEYEEQMEEMEAAMEEIQRDVDALQLENQLFHRYLKVCWADLGHCRQRTGTAMEDLFFFQELLSIDTCDLS